MSYFTARTRRLSGMLCTGLLAAATMSVDLAAAQTSDPCENFTYDRCIAACPTSGEAHDACERTCYSTSFTCDFPVDFRTEFFSDTSVFRPSTGTWFVRNGKLSAYREIIGRQWGLPGDWPFALDNLAGADTVGIDLAVWRPRNGNWYICTDANFVSDCREGFAIQFGQAGDYPLTFDFDADGFSDLAAWRPYAVKGKTKEEGQWYVRKSSDLSVFSIQWGLRDDLPLVTDVDGDNLPDLAVWRPSNGTWYILLSTRAYDRNRPFIRQWGLPGDHPLFFPVAHLADSLPGQAAELSNALAVWRPTEGNWYICPLNLTDTACNSPVTVQFGLPGDIPIAGALVSNYAQKVSTTDRLVSVFRPSSGEWYYGVFDPSNTGGYKITDTLITQWGLPGDIPTTADIKTRVSMLTGVQK